MKTSMMCWKSLAYIPNGSVVAWKRLKTGVNENITIFLFLPSEKGASEENFAQKSTNGNAIKV